MTHEKDPKKSAKLCFDKIGLDPENYRIGHTKARKYTAPLWNIAPCLEILRCRIIPQNVLQVFYPPFFKHKSLFL